MPGESLPDTIALALPEASFSASIRHLCEALPLGKVSWWTLELSHTPLSSARLRSQSLQKSELLARTACCVFLGRQQPSPILWEKEPADASPVRSGSSPSHLSTSKVALQPLSARTVPAPPSFIRLPTHSAGFLWHQAPVTPAEQPPPRSPILLLPPAGHHRASPAVLPQAPRRPSPSRFILGWTCFAHP